jgi:hypothetical protein
MVLTLDGFDQAEMSALRAIWTEEPAMSYGTTKQEAERIAAELNARKDNGTLTVTDHGERPTTRYIVECYSKGLGLWGVVRRWTYSDRPDLGEFGGAFTWLPDVEHV